MEKELSELIKYLDEKFKHVDKRFEEMKRDFVFLLYGLKNRCSKSRQQSLVRT